MSDVNDKFQSTNGLTLVCVRESADDEIEMSVTYAHKRDRIQLHLNTQAHKVLFPVRMKFCVRPENGSASRMSQQ